MHVVLMPRPRNHNPGRPAKAGRIANEDRLRTGREEPIEEHLREPVVDLATRRRRALLTVASRKVDVDVEPVLVGRVIVHRAAAFAADVADHDARRVRVLGAVRAGHREDRADRVLVSVKAFPHIRGAVGDWVPRHPVRPAHRQLRSVHEAAAVRQADGRRVMPSDRRNAGALRWTCCGFGGGVLHGPDGTLVEPERETGWIRDRERLARTPLGAKRCERKHDRRRQRDGRGPGSSSAPILLPTTRAGDVMRRVPAGVRRSGST